MTRRLIALAAGGTGGHVFPAEALAAALQARGHRVAIVTDRRGRAWNETLQGAEVFHIRADTLRAGLIGKARTAVELVMGYGQARGILKALGPAAVVGFGGYPSAPTIFAAGRLGLPVLIHEQNAVLGRANRMLAGSARVIASSFPEVAGIRPADRGKVVLTGNPVRPAVAALAGEPYHPPGEEGPLRLLITGGSQGARVFSEVVPAALARLPEAVRARLEVAQQCRPEDLAAAEAAYAPTGIRRELSPFFRDVPRRLAAAHLVICRSGASTIAELTAAGRPAVLVPYPHAMDDHQTANARALDAAGAAWLMPQPAMTPETLAVLLRQLIAEPALLARRAAAAAALGRPDAAERLEEAVLALAGEGSNGDEGRKEAAA